MSICTCTPKQKASGKQSPVCEAHMGFRLRIARRGKPRTLLQSYKNDIEFIQGKYQEDLALFARRVREHWVIPACKKYKLRFVVSGTGIFFFARWVRNRDIYIHDRDDARAHGIPRGLDRVFELLEIAVDTQRVVGNLVDHVANTESEE